MKERRVLFIENDAGLLDEVGAHFGDVGHTVQTVGTAGEGVAAFRAVHPDVVVVGLDIPGGGGMSVLEALRQHGAAVIMLADHGQIEDAVEAMRLGAENFLMKPVELPHLELAIDKAAEKAALRRENRELKARLAPGIKRRLVRAAALVVLVLVSALIGSLIGRGPQGVRGGGLSRPLGLVEPAAVRTKGVAFPAQPFPWISQSRRAVPV